ncbi:uncharacterized protein RSE6_09954 [Rhynchosporium secalis]|uniref:Ribosomal protein S21 n=1 Tax=Rhynchosporium secalis TaxID=38038 RepID=A0A1E1MK86_RHYSE|nr:uncharacterized protein RSE6_09954 [Rhynchosporium secalis]
MEIRRVADALLRSQTSHLAAFLSPATTGRLGQKTCSNRQIQRSFTSSVQRSALRPSATTTSTPPPSVEASTPSSDRSDNQPAMQGEAKSPGWAARPRPSNYGTPTLTPEKERALNGGTSAGDLMATLNLKKRDNSRMQVNRMKDVGSFSNRIGGSFADAMAAETGVFKAARKPILLNPSTGRSVSVTSQIDVAKSFRLMEMRCARNRIKRDSMTQRYHERGGMKRKRLRRERWRKRFLEGFKATIVRVKQLKRQGW